MSRDLAILEQALRLVFPAMTGLLPLTTGFSNDTYLVGGCDLILRLPPAAGAMLDGHDVIGQARIYQELAGVQGAPTVPGIAMIGEDASLLGAPFYVMERVPGEAVHDIHLQSWFTGASDAVRRDICQKWVTAYAGLARLQLLQSLGQALSPDEDARRWQRFAAAANCPELVALYDRLLSAAAPVSGPPAIVHGDAKLSNLMWLGPKTQVPEIQGPEIQGPEISAVLDWELALNGEPLADLGYMLFGFEGPFHKAATPARQPGMLNRDQVIALWSKVSGRSAEGLFWHEIAQIGKLSAIIAEGTNMFVTGRSTDPKLAMFQKNGAHFLGVMAAMLDHANL
ncbi:MAG: hypothetical protein RL367_2300 [Pseudomonadota bacterium]